MSIRALRTPHPRGPVEYALLGLLRLGPRHGYELVGEFAPETELGDTVHVDLSNLYAALKRLERQGLVASQTEHAGTRPPRHVYRQTAVGEAEFERWLHEPVQHNRDIRLDFILKLFFLLRLEPDAANELLARQLAAAMDQLQYLQGNLQQHAPGSFGWILRQMRLSAVRGTINWLEAVRGIGPGQQSTTI